MWQGGESERERQREQNTDKIGSTVADWQLENLFIVGLQMWLLWHRRAAILLCWSGSTLHFLTCQHGQAKHRAFWHRHFTSLILTDNSNRKEAWHGVIPSGPPQQPMCCAYSLRERSALSMTVLFLPGMERKMSRLASMLQAQAVLASDCFLMKEEIALWIQIFI